jgi:hypothetical protein
MDGCEFNPAPYSMGAQTFTRTKSGRDMRLTTDLHLMQGLRNFYRLYIQSTIRIHGVHMDNTPFALCGSCPLQLVQCCGTIFRVLREPYETYRYRVTK